MENKQLDELLGTSEGLTEDFKAKFPAIFTEAVEKAAAEKAEAECKAKCDEKDAECAKKCADVEEECGKKLAEKDEELKDAQEKLDEAVKDKNEYLSALEEKVEELANVMVEEKYQETLNNVDRYLQVVVEKFIADHEDALVESARNGIASDFMTGIAALFEQNNIREPEMVDKLQEQKAEHEAELNEAYETIGDLVEQREELESKLHAVDVRETLRECAFEHDLSESEFEKLCGLMEGFDGDMDVIKSKANELAESLNVPAEEETVAVVAPQVVSESVVEIPADAPAKQSLSDDVAGVLYALKKINNNK